MSSSTPARSGGDHGLTKGAWDSCYRRVPLVSLAAFSTMGIAVANADAPTITGYPNQIKKVNLDGSSFRRATRSEPTPGSRSSRHTGPRRCLRMGCPMTASGYPQLRRDAGRKQDADGRVIPRRRHDRGRVRHELPERRSFRCSRTRAPPNGPTPPSLGTVKVLAQGASRIPPPDRHPARWLRCCRPALGGAAAPPGLVYLFSSARSKKATTRAAS